MGIISLFRADVDSRIEKRLTALESAIADLPAKISAAEKTVLWDLFERDFDAMAKGANKVWRELNDLPEKIAAYEKIYLKSVLKEIDPEAVAAELDEAQALLSAFSEEVPKIIAALEKEAKRKDQLEMLEKAPEGWISLAELAEKYGMNNQKVALILRTSGVFSKLIPRAVLKRNVYGHKHYRIDEAERAIAEWKERQIDKEDSE